ncbi:MAG: TMEM165/GDT1 family protein [Gloeomargaritaceae cyanobacterium C42_A2020_066]|nr:TMEM165/GDT1 family protein [Gloeomargaritaceae cyanobacterium C42_A2020_066]
MDWQLLGVTFLTVFLAELGDKSQLATIALSSRCQTPWVIFAGTTTALILVTTLGVGLGHGLGNVVSPLAMKGLAALGFLVLGLKTLISAWRPAGLEAGQANLALPKDQ